MIVRVHLLKCVCVCVCVAYLEKSVQSKIQIHNTLGVTKCGDICLRRSIKAEEIQRPCETKHRILRLK